jgi:hypothetical protein
VKAFLRFWYDFIVGDDWTIACGVVLALAATALLAHNGLKASWWLLPLVVALGLIWSVLRGARASKNP